MRQNMRKVCMDLIHRFSRLIPLWVTPFDYGSTDTTILASIEFTSKCNLRCVYCGKSSETEYSKTSVELSVETIYQLVNNLKSRGVEQICVSGIGETTTHGDWCSICENLLNDGFKLKIITNMSRQFSVKEATVLSRFQNIEVSIDTAEADLFKKIRRGSKLDTLIANLDLIKSIDGIDGKNKVKIRFASVITDQTLFGIDGLISLGYSHGVYDFYFADLFKNPDIEGDFNVYDILHIPVFKWDNAYDYFESARIRAISLGCNIETHPGLLEKLKYIKNNSINNKDFHRINQFHSWNAPPPKKGCTRNCIDPWIYAFITSTGEMQPCCAYNESIGNINKNTLTGAINSEAGIKLRNGLLSGDLENLPCEYCSMRDVIEINRFRAKIRNFKLLRMFKSFVVPQI